MAEEISAVRFIVTSKTQEEVGVARIGGSLAESSTIGLELFYSYGDSFFLLAYLRLFEYFYHVKGYILGFFLDRVASV